LKYITEASFINPTQEMLCEIFPGVYYNFVCRYTEGTHNINEYNRNLGKYQTKRNTLRNPKLIRSPALISNVEHPLSESTPLLTNISEKLLTGRIAETEKRKKYIRNYYTNPRYLSDTKEKLKIMRENINNLDEELIAAFEESPNHTNSRYVSNKKEKLNKTRENRKRYVQEIKNLEELIAAFEKSPNHTGGKTRYVKGGRNKTRKR